MIRLLKRLKSFYWQLYLNCRGVRGGQGIKVYKKPLVKIKQGQITIGRNVILNSNYRNYRAFMGGPTKLYVEGGGRIIIGNNCQLAGCSLNAREQITIEDNCQLAANTSIMDSHGHQVDPRKRNQMDEPQKIVIGENVWVGINCVILKGVTIGRNSVIGANSVISTDIPANSLVRSGGTQIIIETLQIR